MFKYKLYTPFLRCRPHFTHVMHVAALELVAATARALLVLTPMRLVKCTLTRGVRRVTALQTHTCILWGTAFVPHMYIYLWRLCFVVCHSKKNPLNALQLIFAVILNMKFSWLLLFPSFAALQNDFDGDGLSDDMELLLAKQFAPVVHFHPLEMFFPSAVEPYLAATDLYFQRHYNAPACKFTAPADMPLPVLTLHDDIEAEVCIGDGKPALRGGNDVNEECSWSNMKCNLFNTTAFNIVECNTAESRLDQYFFLHAGRAIKNNFNGSAPVYVHVHPADMFGERSIVVQYWFFYSFNGPLDDMLSAGAHEGDWEHVSVVVDDATRQHVRAVYMAAHSHEAHWLFPSDMELDGTHVHTYVALHSHAMYETPGVKKRISDNMLYSFLHDHCSNSGHVWNPQVFVNMGEKECPLVPWAFYNGFWGSKKLIYSFIPLPFDTASPPRSPMHQLDYWFTN